MKTPLGYDCQSVPHITVNLSKCFHGFEGEGGGEEGCKASQWLHIAVYSQTETVLCKSG